MRINLSLVLAALALLGSPARGDEMAPLTPLTQTLAANVPASTHDWTGFYLGSHIGGIWGSVDQRQTNGGMDRGPFSYDASGPMGGVTAGYNFQAGNLVLGIEGDLGYADFSGSGRIPSSNPAAHQDIALGDGLYGDITARAGIAWDKVLVYGKGGFAFYDGAASQTTTNPGFVTHDTGAFAGWVAGAGIEYAMTPRISLKFEWLHFNFDAEGGDQTSISDPPVGYVYRNTSDVEADAVKLGANFKF